MSGKNAKGKSGTSQLPETATEEGGTKNKVMPVENQYDVSALEVAAESRKIDGVQEKNSHEEKRDSKIDLNLLLHDTKKHLEWLAEKIAQLESGEIEPDDIYAFSDSEEEDDIEETIPKQQEQTAASSGSSRYPKRNVPRKNYREEEVLEDDDDYLYCDDCEIEYEDCCPVHGPLQIMSNKKVPKGKFIPDRAKLTLPDMLSISRSSIPKAGLGIWTEVDLPKGLVFGPYEGVEVHDFETARKSGYAWLIKKKGKPHHYIDAQDTSKSNWLRYINCANNERFQNLVAFQYKGKIYYRTYKPVKKYTELLVWYGDEYAQDIGIDLQDDDVEDEIKVQGFQCQKCLRTFSEKKYLDGHVKQHRDDTGLRRHKCQFCSYSTDKTTSLEHHLRTHTGEKPHMCDECGKRFTELRNLKQHVLVHSGEKPYQCDLCHKAFNRKISLETHIRTHTKEKPYTCNTCGKGFTTASDLRTHEVIHESSMPFKCSYCEYRSNQSVTVRIHVIHRHTKQYPHQCPTCKKGFIKPGEVKKHLLKKHNATEE